MSHTALAPLATSASGEPDGRIGSHRVARIAQLVKTSPRTLAV